MFKSIKSLLPPGPALQCRPAGDALLLQTKGRNDQAAWRFAGALARDDQHTVVVVDVPGIPPDTAADAMARALADSGGSLRMVFGNGTSAEIRRAGQRIAEELGKVVVVPDGEVLPTAGGGLYIPGGHGSGWLRLRPGRPVEHDSMGFPKPRWQFSMADRPWATSPYAVVEPLPCGVWVRGALPDGADDHRRRLFGLIAVDPDVMTVVLGCPGGPAVPLADVLRFWETVLPSTRSRVRFVHYGPVALPQEGEALGQQLADALEHQVVLYTGAAEDDPAAPGDADAADAGAAGGGRTSSPAGGGTGSGATFVREVLYSPRGTEGAPPPALAGVRAPLPGFHPVAPGVYEYAFDAVLEVVQSGLWMRPPEEPADGDDVRRIAPVPGDRLFLYHRGSPELAARMRALAEDALWRLGADARGDFVLRPADDPAVDTGAWYAEPIAVPDPYEAVTAAIPPATRPAGTAPWTPVTVEGSARDAVADNDVVTAEAVEAEVTLGSPAPAPAPAPTQAAASAAVTSPFQAEVWATAAEDLSAPAPAARAAAAPEPAGPRPLPELTAGLGLPTGWVTSTATESVPAEPAVAEPFAVEAVVAETVGATAVAGAGVAGEGVPEPPEAVEPVEPVVATGVADTVIAEEGALAPPVPVELPAVVEPVEPAEATGAVDTVVAEENAPAPPEAVNAGPAAPAVLVPMRPMPEADQPSIRRLPLPLAHPATIFPPSPDSPSPDAVPADTAPTAAPELPAEPDALPSNGAEAPRPAAPPPGTLPLLGGLPVPPSTPPVAPPVAPPPMPLAPPTVAAEPAAPPAPAAPAVTPAAAPPAPAARPAGLRLESAGAFPAAPVTVEPPVKPMPPAADSAPAEKAPAPAAPAGAPPAPAAPSGVRVQPVPKGAACAVPPERGIERERDWVRKTFRAQYDVAAGTVSRVMSEVPGLRGGSREKATDALIDLVAVRLYLTGNSAGVDASVRSARVGPHVPLARCVASGLRRLPSYRGIAVLGAELTDAERAWYRDGRLVTEWSFCAASAQPIQEVAERPRFVVWSMTARRTSLLDGSAPDRVVFLPGTTFKVLRPAAAAGDLVLIREMAATEIGADGRVAPGRTALDERALESLERAAAALPRTPVAADADRPRTPHSPPGLMPEAPRPGARARTDAPAAGAHDKGATQ
ncbi:hypothetical protein [Streptomyces sp. CA2R106]|uniref:hypothetical protein n=1 Tax=Streptomyces sp. CA2R106 TaxID=3120153 RepID=UPI00300AA3E9